MPEEPVTTYSYRAAGPDPLRDLSAEQRGNVTPVHCQLLADLTPGPGSTWSERALWACLERLRTGTWTQTPEIRVERAWTDGPEAFCVIYAGTYDPDLRVGIRVCRDSDSHENEPESAVDSNDLSFIDPIWFGGQIADYSIGEPLGTVMAVLRTDEHGVKWWGSLHAELPTTPS